MKNYSIGDDVIVGGKKATVTQIFPGDDVATYEVTFKNGTTDIVCL